MRERLWRKFMSQATVGMASFSVLSANASILNLANLSYVLVLEVVASFEIDAVRKVVVTAVYTWQCEFSAQPQSARPCETARRLRFEPQESGSFQKNIRTLCEYSIMSGFFWFGA